MLSLVRNVGICLALLALVPRSALGQEPEPAPVITPPLPQQSTDVPYPEGATGDAAVELELVVEADGTVSSAIVLDGVEPFAEHARQAALAWRFNPALRDDVPVSARIRARVAFRKEPEEEPQIAPQVPSAAPSTAPVEPVPPPVAVTPVEVVVRGSRSDAGQTTLTAKEVRQMPGAFGDPFRAIEPLPGVTPYVSGIPYFYVRGAPPNDNGYYVDGIRVPLLFHVGLGEGVIHPGLMESIDFFPSVAPARYGGFVGATIAGQTREPAPEFRGEANLRLIDAGALVEAPFASGRGNALVAGRYGYPGPVLSVITPDVALDYWDYQARASFRVAERSSVGVFAFGSHDYFATGKPEEREEQLVSDFHRLDLRFDHETNAGKLRFAVTGGYDSQGAHPVYVTDELLGARVELEQELSSDVRLRGGASAQLDRYGFDEEPAIESSEPGQAEPDIPSTANPPPKNVTGAIYADVAWQVDPRLAITPGVRVGLFRSTRPAAVGSEQSITTSVLAVDPRLALRLTLAPGVALLAAGGLVHQYPTLRVDDIPAAVVSVPGFPYGTKRLQRAEQASLGTEVQLPGDLVLTVTGFVSRFWGLTDLTAGCYQPMPGSEVIDDPGPLPEESDAPWICPNDTPVGGRSFGGELLVQRSITKRLNGLLSYTLSRSTRQAHFVDASGVDTLETVPSENDRTHVFNAVLGYELGARWRAGGRFVYFTGNPYSKMDGNIPIPPYNTERYAAFYRVDFRVEKSWPLGKDGSISFVVEGQNVTLNKQSAGLACRSTAMPVGESLHSTTTCSPEMIGPITLPSLGVEAFF